MAMNKILVICILNFCPNLPEYFQIKSIDHPCFTESPGKVRIVKSTGGIPKSFAFIIFTKYFTCYTFIKQY